MELKIKAVKKHAYALRIYDKEGCEIFYTSTRINAGIKFIDENLICDIPDLGHTYKLTMLTKTEVSKEGKIKE